MTEVVDEQHVGYSWQFNNEVKMISYQQNLRPCIHINVLHMISHHHTATAPLV